MDDDKKHINIMTSIYIHMRVLDKDNCICIFQEKLYIFSILIQENICASGMI